jgi:Fic-DOC domain mobile mystery protein B
MGGLMRLLKQPENSTPIGDISDLIPAHILTKKELDLWESENILKASRKYLGKKHRPGITTEWLKKVHRDMFDDTWKWAGNFRQSNLNIGIDRAHIAVEMKKLCDDVNYWNKNGTYSILEQSTRLHFRLAYIHAFPNGNGRHARLVQDIFLYYNDHGRPQWPSEELLRKSPIRKDYIDCLKSADKGDYKPLLEFIRKLL